MGVQIPSGRPKLTAPFMGAFSFDLPRIRRDLKPTVKKMPLWGIFREERLWRHSCAQDATSEAESLGLYKVLRACFFQLNSRKRGLNLLRKLNYPTDS